MIYKERLRDLGEFDLEKRCNYFLQLPKKCLERGQSKTVLRDTLC